MMREGSDSGAGVVARPATLGGTLRLRSGQACEGARPETCVWDAYCTGAPLAKQLAGFPSAADRITADWSAQNAFRPKPFRLGAAVS